MTREEAIKIVRENMHLSYDEGNIFKALQTLVPELRESEDERMMRVIGLALTDVPEERFTSLGTTLKDCLAYLERQKEQKVIKFDALTWQDINELESIMNEVHSDFRTGIGEKNFGLEVLERFLYNRDNENIDTTEPKFREGDEIQSIDGQYKDTVLEVLSDGSYRLKNLGLLSIPESEWELANGTVNGYELIDNKPAELEQLAKLRKMTNEIREAYERGIEVGRVEPKQEWSEEDEENLGKLHRLLVICQGEKKFIPTDEFNKLDSWLKSFRPQPHWKPSDEQLRPLEYAIDYFKKKRNDTTYLESLYNDLKKLM